MPYRLAMRLAPLLLAALLVTSAGLSGAVGSAPPATDTDPGGAADLQGAPTPPLTAVEDETQPNETNVSELNESRVLVVPDGAIQRTSVERHTVDVGPALSFGANESAIRLETIAVEERVAAAATSEDRAAEIDAALTTVEEKTQRLHAREQAAIDAFNAGEIDAQQFLVRLAAIDAESRALQDRLVALDRLAGETADYDIDRTRLAEVRFELRTLEGPVRERAARALSAEASAVRVFVETGPEGIVLATVDDGTYMREAFRGAIRTRESTIAPARALNVTSKTYPEIWKSRLTEGVQATGSGETYVVTVPHARGELTAFVDGGTERVFKEFQTRPLDTYLNRTAATTVKDGLRLVVNRTYPGGPLRIALWDAETGQPVNATVTISQGTQESTVLGRTGEDGVLWTVSPRGQYDVTAIQGQTAAVIVSTEPTAVPEVEDPD